MAVYRVELWKDRRTRNSQKFLRGGTNHVVHVEAMENTEIEVGENICVILGWTSGVAMKIRAVADRGPSQRRAIRTLWCSSWQRCGF